MLPRLLLRSSAKRCHQIYICQRNASNSSSPETTHPVQYTDPGAAAVMLNLDGDDGESTETPYSSEYPPSSDSLDAGALRSLRNLLDQAQRRFVSSREDHAELALEKTKMEDMCKQMTRNWRTGDVYAPHDLSSQEMLKWRQPQQPKKDIIDMLGLNPTDHYRNFSIMAEFMTPMGRIKHSRETGLRPVNQRKMAKAIRRSIGLGLHPSTHHHPMIIYCTSSMVPKFQNSSKPAPDNAKVTPK